MKGSRARCLYHLRKLRDKGLVDEKFGRLLSKKAEKAYAIYFRERLPIVTIGRKAGIKKFSLNHQTASGIGMECSTFLLCLWWAGEK
jgi:hypothetical protein